MLLNRLALLNQPELDEQGNPIPPSNPQPNIAPQQPISGNVNFPSFQPQGNLQQLAGGYPTVPGDNGDSSNVVPFPQGGQTNRLAALASTTPMLDKYKQAVSNPPNPADFQPGKVQRLAAMMGGAAAGFRSPLEGVQTARTILERPYANAMDLYSKRTKTLEGAASVEERNVTNQRLAENESQKNLIASGRAQDQKALDEARAAYYGARTVALSHPNWRVAKANGRVVLYDPAKPTSRVDLGDASILSPEAMKQQIDKFRKENGIKVEGEQKVEGTRQRNRRSNLEFTEEGKNKRAAARAGNKNISASQYSAAYRKAMQEVIGDPANAGAFKGIVNPPTKDAPYYTIKDVYAAGPNDLAQHQVLLSKIAKRTNEILGRNNGSDIELPNDNNEDDNDDNDIDVEEADK